MSAAVGESTLPKGKDSFAEVTKVIAHLTSVVEKQEAQMKTSSAEFESLLKNADDSIKRLNESFESAKSEIEELKTTAVQTSAVEKLDLRLSIIEKSVEKLEGHAVE